jgi:hypothetical protein
MNKFRQNVEHLVVAPALLCHLFAPSILVGAWLSTCTSTLVPSRYLALVRSSIFKAQCRLNCSPADALCAWFMFGPCSATGSRGVVFPGPLTVTLLLYPPPVSCSDSPVPCSAIFPVVCNLDQAANGQDQPCKGSILAVACAQPRRGTSQGTRRDSAKYLFYILGSTWVPQTQRTGFNTPNSHHATWHGKSTIGRKNCCTAAALSSAQDGYNTTLVLSSISLLAVCALAVLVHKLLQLKTPCQAALTHKHLPA